MIYVGSENGIIYINNSEMFKETGTIYLLECDRKIRDFTDLSSSESCEYLFEFLKLREENGDETYNLES